MGVRVESVYRAPSDKALKKMEIIPFKWFDERKKNK